MQISTDFLPPCHLVTPSTSSGQALSRLFQGQEKAGEEEGVGASGDEEIPFLGLGELGGFMHLAACFQGG